jgi:RNA polymerase sigma-70 factor (ECF subfamily)
MTVEPWFAREDFAALYPRLRRFAAVVGPLDVEPDDLVQEALAAMLRRPAPPDHAEAFLRRSIANLAISGGRRRARWDRRMPVLADRDRHDDAYPSSAPSLDALSPQARAIVWMVDVEGRSSTDVAAVLGMRDAAVRQQLARARKRLRAELAEEER